MPNCVNYNCDELPEYEDSLAECGALVRNGGASGMYLLECDANISDPGNQAQLDAAVNNGTAKYIPGVKIGFSQPSPIEVDSTTSCGTKKTINYDREFSGEDFKVTQQNTTFWSTAKKRVYGGVVLMECDTSGLDPVVTFIDAEVSLTAYRDFPNTVDSPQKYVFTGKWKSYDDPQQLTYTP